MTYLLLAIAAGAALGYAIARLGNAQFTHWVGTLSWPMRLVIFALILGALGQFGRIPPLSGDILLADICIVLAASIFGFQALAKKRRVIGGVTTWIVVSFAAYILLSLAASPVATSMTILVKGAVYALRFIAYCIVPFILASEKMRGMDVVKLLFSVMVLVVLFGYLQLVLVPDIGFLNRYGWDPHVGRLVSTFLDPNFLGGYFGLLIALLFAWQSQDVSNIRWFWLVVTLCAVVLTYSRSGYLAVFMVLAVAGILYSWKLFLFGLVVLVPVGLSIPRVQERITGAFEVDATSQARILSWKEAFEVAEKRPISGVGYNLYGPAQVQLGIRGSSDESRAANASDSSILNIIATMGLFGTTFFVVLFYRLIATIRAVWLADDMAKRITARALVFASLGILANSFFVNAFFYPLLLLPLMMLVGVLISEGKESGGIQKTHSHS